MTDTEDYARAAPLEAHGTTHQNDGSDEVNVQGLSGKLADEQDAGKIKGLVVPAPAAGDDEKALVYDHDTGQFKYATPGAISDDIYGAGWDGVTTIGASKNALYDELETRLKAAAVITDHRLVRGDGGARGVQESTIIVSDDGEMTNPSQPVFHVKPAEDQDNIAVGENVTVVFGAEIYDIGNNFASNTFTAPITGKYQFNAKIHLADIDVSAIYYHLRIITSNRTFYLAIPSGGFAADFYMTFSMSVVADMDVNDTLIVAVYEDIGGAAQTDIDDGSTDFNGFLIC